jgi:hypothetical protein
MATGYPARPPGHRDDRHTQAAILNSLTKCGHKPSGWPPANRRCGGWPRRAEPPREVPAAERSQEGTPHASKAQAASTRNTPSNCRRAPGRVHLPALRRRPQRPLRPRHPVVPGLQPGRPAEQQWRRTEPDHRAGAHAGIQPQHRGHRRAHLRLRASLPWGPDPAPGLLALASRAPLGEPGLGSDRRARQRTPTWPSCGIGTERASRWRYRTAIAWACDLVALGSGP